MVNLKIPKVLLEKCKKKPNQIKKYNKLFNMTFSAVSYFYLFFVFLINASDVNRMQL